MSPHEFREMRLDMILSAIFILVVFLAVVGMRVIKPVNWQEANLTVQEIFSKSYDINKDCKAAIRADGLGVVLWAVDNNWHGQSIAQKVMIEPNEWGGARVQKEYIVKSLTTTDGTSLNSHGSNDYEYDVFYSKCREDARRLPQEVKKAFLGIYDLR